MKCSWCRGDVNNGTSIHGGCSDAKSRVEEEKLHPKKRRGRLGHAKRKLRPLPMDATSDYYKGALVDFRTRMAKRGIKI